MHDKDRDCGASLLLMNGLVLSTLWRVRYHILTMFGAVYGSAVKVKQTYLSLWGCFLWELRKESRKSLIQWGWIHHAVSLINCFSDQIHFFSFSLFFPKRTILLVLTIQTAIISVDFSDFDCWTSVFLQYAEWMGGWLDFQTYSVINSFLTVWRLLYGVE